MGPPLSVIRKKPKLNFWADTPHLKTCTIYGQPTKESAYVQNVKSLQNMSLYGGQGKFLSIVRGYLSLIPSCQLPDSKVFLCCVPIWGLVTSHTNLHLNLAGKISNFGGLQWPNGRDRAADHFGKDSIMVIWTISWRSHVVQASASQDSIQITARQIQT